MLFLVAFLAVMVAGGLLSSDPLPRPGDPPDSVYEWFQSHGQVALLTGLLQGLSVVGLGVFAASMASRLAGRAATVTRCLWALAVMSMLVSVGISAVLGVLVTTFRPETVATLQDVSFRAGGVVHVVAVGVLVLVLRGQWAWPRGVRVLGVVAAVPAVLSLLSVPFFAASPLLPLGRVLCMVWAVAAGVSLLRRPRPAR